jgi:FkbM family methyltransferase
LFDVGAFEGQNATLFAKRGWQVIALEPNPTRFAVLQAKLRDFEKTGSVALQVACGPENGSATLHLATVNLETLCTMSESWIAAVQKSKRFPGDNWPKTLTVSQVSLDYLIYHYGKPDMILIDAEGYESQILAGLSYAVKEVVFEYHVEWLDDAIACIDKLNALGPYRHNYALGESALVLPKYLHWIEFLREFERVRDKPLCWGNVYCLRGRGTRDQYAGGAWI